MKSKVLFPPSEDDNKWESLSEEDIQLEENQKAIEPEVLDEKDIQKSESLPSNKKSEDLTEVLKEYLSLKTKDKETGQLKKRSHVLIEKLYELAEWGDRSAIFYILDRVCGKPAVSIKMNSDVDDEVANEIAALRKDLKNKYKSQDVIKDLNESTDKLLEDNKEIKEE